MFTVTFQPEGVHTTVYQWLYEDYTKAIKIAKIIYNRYKVQVVVDHMAYKNLKTDVSKKYKDHRSKYKKTRNQGSKLPLLLDIDDDTNTMYVKNLRPKIIKLTHTTPKLHNRSIDYNEMSRRVRFQLPLFDSYEEQGNKLCEVK